MRFAKYHALGNDYIVIPPDEAGPGLTPDVVRWLCDRHFGVGSDGVLLGPLPAQNCDFGLRLFNPDGGEFEKSGNGLRIFARYLWDVGLVRHDPFTVQTAGGDVRCTVHPGGKLVSVDIGRISFHSRDIPVRGPEREVLNEVLWAAGEELQFCAATLGNPHCVVLREQVSRADASRLGPLIETDPRFPNRTNVQFLQVIDWSNIQIEIWERGAGYTLSSGTSGCAAAAVAHRLGLCGREISVNMPGGRLNVNIYEEFFLTMQGGVSKICEGVAYEHEA